MEELLKTKARIQGLPYSTCDQKGKEFNVVVKMQKKKTKPYKAIVQRKLQIKANNQCSIHMAKKSEGKLASPTMA